MLFFAFSMMHEFDWLLPANPAVSVATTSSIPLTDVLEETGSEDEIEHELGYVIISNLDNQILGQFLISENSYITSVLSPPPDLI